MTYIPKISTGGGYAPRMSALMGTTSRQAVLDSINSRFGEGSVIFASASDGRMRDRYDRFLTIVEETTKSGVALQQSVGFKLSRNKVLLLENDEDLNVVPEVMRPHILTMPSIRAALKEGSIFGWGIEDDSLTEEDVAGRLIGNGVIEQDLDTMEVPEYYHYEWDSEDPDFTPEELEIIDMSRKFCDGFMKREIESGRNLDFSDYSQMGKMGKLR